MPEVNSIANFNTEVTLHVIDEEGNITASITDKNAETLWAKINTPVSGTLSLDFITHDVSLIYGVSLPSLIKTSHTELSNLRANLLSSAFTLTGNIYQLSFSWYNNTGSAVTLYGLVSYTDASLVYTVFDMSSNPIVILPGSTAIGNYKITYDVATPVVLASTTVNSTQNVNKIFSGLRENISDNLRSYKLSRLFIKTSVYPGSNINDTSFISNLIITVTNTNFSSYSIYNNYTAEIFYKCLSSGSPGGAVVSRFIIPSLVNTYINTASYTDTVQIQVNSNVSYLLDQTTTYAMSNGGLVRGWSGQSLDPLTVERYTSPCTITCTNDTDTSIYPFQVKYPSFTTLIEPYLTFTSLAWGTTDGGGVPGPPWNTPDGHINVLLYHNSAPPLTSDVLSVGPDGYANSCWQHVQIMYWDAAPTLTVYVNCPLGGAYWQVIDKKALSAYINGTLFTSALPTTVGTYDGYGGGWLKYTFTLTGLPSSGSGVMVLRINEPVSTYTWNHQNYIFPAVPDKLILCTNMYSYIIPYGGMMSLNSSTITSGWVSPACVNVNGVDTNLTAALSNASDAHSITTIQNTSLSVAMSSVKYQYNISVTQAQAASLAGIVSKNNIGWVYSLLSWPDAGYALARYNCIPYYVTSSNYVHFGLAFYRVNIGTTGYGSGQNYVPGAQADILRSNTFHVNPAYYESIYTSACNPAITINVGARTLSYNNAAPCVYKSTTRRLDDLKLRVFRQQGGGNYTYQLPENLCTYVEGTPTVVWGGATYEFETVLQTSENIDVLHLSIDPTSIFATNEYFSFPFCSKNTLIMDSLETWNLVNTANIPKSRFDDSILARCVGSDALIDPSDTDITKTNELYVNTGEAIPYDVQLPLSTVQVEGNSDYTHVLTFTVSWNSSTSQYPAIHIPKVITRSSIQLLTNVQSVYVTDGIHVIPWSLNPDHAQQQKLTLNSPRYSWELVLNRTVLSQLYPVNTTVIVYAYVQAKNRSNWLPYNVDIRSIFPTNYTDNNGINTLVLLHANGTEGALTITNSASLPNGVTITTSSSSIYTTYAHTMLGLGSFFIPNNTSYIQIANSLGSGNLISGSDKTIDFWMFPTNLAASQTLVTSYNLSMGYQVSYQCGWWLELYTGYGAGTAQLLFHYGDDAVHGTTVQGNAGSVACTDTGLHPLTTYTWYHVALVMSEGFLNIYINGTCEASVKMSLETGAGLRFGDSTTGFIGYLAEIHVTKGALWLEEFIPPAYPWGSSNLDTIGIQYKPTALIPIELPIAFDQNINVINSNDGSDVTFFQSDPFNRQLTDIGFSNILYLKASTITGITNNNTRVSYIELPIRTRGSYFLDGGMSGLYMGLSCCFDKGSRSLAHSLVGMKPHRAYSVMTTGNIYGYLTNAKYKSLGYKFKDTIEIPDSNVASVQIVTSGTPKSVGSSSIFINAYNAAQIISSSSTPQYYTLIDEDHCTYNQGSLTGLNVNYSKLLSNTIVEVKAANTSLLIEAQQNVSSSLVCACFDSNNRTTQKYTAQFTAYPTSSGVLSTNNKITTAHYVASPINANLAYLGFLVNIMMDHHFDSSARSGNSSVTGLIQYQKINSLFTTSALDLYYTEPGLLTPSYVDTNSGPKVSIVSNSEYTVLNSNLIDITDMSTNPTQFLYTTNKSINPGDTSVFKISNTAITNTANIDIVTYVPSAYTYLVQPYVNSAGTHLLSNSAAALSYEVLLSNRFMLKSHSAYKCAFTKNAELISILNTNNLVFPYTIGYVNDTYAASDVLTKGTVYTGSQTNTIVIEAPMFGSRQIAIGALTGVERHQLTAYKDIYNNIKTDTMSYFMDNIKYLTFIVNNYQKHVYPDASITSNSGWTGMCFTQYPYFNNYNLDELYINTHFNCTAWDVFGTPGQVGNTTAPIQVSLSTSGTQTYKTGVTINDAIYVDSKVIAKSNTRINIVFDSTNLLVHDITRLGKFSIQNYTNEYGSGAFTYVPIIKVTNTNTSISTIYGQHIVYGTPLDITSMVNALTVNNINILLNNYRSNCFTYEGFNSLLSVFNSTIYTLQLGFIIYSTNTNMLCVFKGMSVEIEFSNASHYTRPDWCYVNKISSLMSATKTDLVSNVSASEVKIYNPNASSLSQYSIRIDVSDYTFTSFTSGIVAKTVSLTSIPTLYEKDTDGHVSNNLGDFNGKGLWINIPYIGANATIVLILTNTTNSFVISDVFSFYEGFNTLDVANLTYSKLDGTSMSATDTSVTPPGQASTERVSAMCHNLSINVVNNALQLTGQESTSVISNVSNLANTNQYEIKYSANDTSNLEVAFGALTNISYTAPLPHFNETVDTKYTFVKTDLHTGDNYFYVYYTSGTATNASTNTIFNVYQDFSVTSIPGWVKYNSGKMTITSGNMAVTSTQARIQCLNCISPKYSYGAIVRVSATVTDYSSILVSLSTSDHAYSGLAVGINSTMRYVGELFDSNNGIGCGKPTATASTYVLTVHQDNLVSAENLLTGTSNGKYYTCENDFGRLQRHGGGSEAFVNLGGSWSQYVGLNNDVTNAMNFTFAAVYKAPKSVNWPPVYSAMETGSWTIDGFVFTNRTKVKFTSTSTDTNCVIKFDRTNFSNNTTLRITSTTALEAFSENTALSIGLGTKKQNIVGIASGSTELIPYWMTASDTENAFIKTDLSKGDNTLYVYYTSSSTALSNGANVFNFYDDFASGTLDVSKWKVGTHAGTGYLIAANQYTAVSTPAHLRSHYLLTGQYSLMTRGSVQSTVVQNSILGIWNNSVDFYGDIYWQATDVYPVGFKYGETTNLELGNIYTNTPATPFTMVMHNHEFDNDKRTILTVYGTSGRVDSANGVYPPNWGNGWANARNPFALSRITGNIRIGTSPHYSTDSGTAINTVCNWVAAWERSKSAISYIWGAEESGSWVVDTFTFTNRKKLTVTTDDADTGVVFRIKQAQFNSLANIRIQRTIKNGHSMRYIDTHRTDTILSFCPANGNVSYRRTLLSDPYAMSDTVTGINVATPSTGSLGITASTGIDTNKVIVKWIRGRAYAPLEPVQLRLADLELLVANIRSDWYFIDTTTSNVHAANVSAITALIASNADLNHDAIFLESWKKFPCSDLIKNGCYGFGRLLNYRN